MIRAQSLSDQINNLKNSFNSTNQMNWMIGPYEKIFAEAVSGEK